MNSITKPLLSEIKSADTVFPPTIPSDERIQQLVREIFFPNNPISQEPSLCIKDKIFFICSKEVTLEMPEELLRSSDNDFWKVFCAFPSKEAKKCNLAAYSATSVRLFLSLITASGKFSKSISVTNIVDVVDLCYFFDDKKKIEQGKRLLSSLFSLDPKYFIKASLHAVNCSLKVQNWILMESICKNEAYFKSLPEEDKATYYNTLLEHALQGHDKSYVFCYFSLAYCALYGIGTDKDKEKAYKLYEEAAGFGNSLAFFYLGIFHHQGNHPVQKDISKAIAFFEKAAKEHFPPALVELGVHMQNCGDSKEDIEKAFNLFNRAKELGYALAYTYLGYFHQKNQELEKAFECFVHAASFGEARAQDCLGDFYRKGLIVGKNDEMALRYYQKAASQQLPSAIYHLGFCYEEGIGVKENPELAMSHFKKAADLGDALAQYELAYGYWQGRGVKEDLPLALHYFELAASQGCHRAKSTLFGLTGNKAF